MTYKPQFGIIFPFALLASRNWRALLSGTATSVALGVIVAIVLGHEVWPSFVRALADHASSFGVHPALGFYPVSVFGLLRSIGISAHISWAVHATVAIIIAAIVCCLWTRPISFSLKAAALALSSIVVTPYVLMYDICVQSIVVAFLMKDGLARGFLTGERTLILISWAATILLFGPFSIIGSTMLFILIIRRSVLCCSDNLSIPGQALRAQG